jgi:hypothetical protein
VSFVHPTNFINYIEVFAKSVGLDPNVYRYKIAGILFCSNTMIYDCASYIFYAINFGLAWDLIRTITNPFESVEARQKLIYLFSPVIFFFIFPIYIYIHWALDMETIGEKNPVCGDVRFDLMTRPGEAVVQITYFITIMYACLLVGMGILRKGLN